MKNPKLKILFEDNHLIAVHKNSGELVQGDKTGDATLADRVKEYIKEKYDKPGEVYLGITHRIDRPVSGVVIYTKTSKALVRMNKLFADKKITKHYKAIVARRPSPIEGTLKHYLTKDNEKNIAKAFDRPTARSKNAKLSELSYSLISEIGYQYLLDVFPATGRPHQIRVQLAKMGWPILGDIKYKSKFRISDHSITLHCFAMSFMHPVTKVKIKIISNLPKKDQHWGKFL